MTDRSHYDEALHRVDASDYQWQEHGSKGSLREAAVAQTHALLAVVDELRRLNDRNERFDASLLEFFERLTEDPYAAPPPGPCTSRTPLITFDNGPLPQQACSLRHGHEGMHESAEGSRWTDDSGSLRSEQPAAALRCDICGHEGAARCNYGTLTGEQWCSHYQHRFDEAKRRGNSDGLAALWASEMTTDRFGPCPEES